jgi:phage gp29-like protein
MRLFNFFNKKDTKKESSVLAATPNVKSLTKEFATNYDSFVYWSKTIDNPDPVLKSLGKDVETYNKLMSDPHLYACVQSRKSGVLSYEWDIDKEYSDSKIVDFVYDIFQKLDVNEITRVILDAPLFGYQPLEIIWELIGGKIIPVSIYKRPRQHFKFDADGNLIFIDDMGNEKDVPKYKFLCPSYEASRSNPYGTPLLSKCYWPVVLKNDVRKFWSIFTEKFGTPWVGARYEFGRYQDEKKVNDLITNLVAMAQDAIFAIPSDVDLQIHNSGQAANAEMYHKYIKECKEEVSEVLLGHTSATTSTPGRLGNESMAIEVVDRIIETDKRLVENTFNELIKMIVELNFVADDYPKFSFYQEEEVNIALAQRDAVLAKDLGVKFSKQYLMRMHNFEEDDFEIEEVKQNEKKEVKEDEEGEPTEKKLKNPNNIHSFRVLNSDEDGEKEQKLTDEFIDELLKPEGTDKLFNKILKPIFDYAGKTELEKMDKDYYKLFKKIKTDDFVELLEKACFIMQIHGSNSVDVNSDDENI